MGIEQKARESIVRIRSLANLVRKHGQSPSFADSLEKIADHLESALRAKGQEETPPLNEPFGNSEQLAEPVSTAYTLPEGRRWPFVESPGEFTERLAHAMQEFPLLGAVRHVLIENPPALAQQPAAFNTAAAPVHTQGSVEQQPASVGEEIMVNAAHDVYTLPLQPSGLSSGPRFVVHVPGPKQPAAPSGEAVAEVTSDDDGDMLIRALRPIPHGTKLYAAPQQPAAVDVALIEAVRAMFDPANTWPMEARLEQLRRALAAQQQEGE